MDNDMDSDVDSMMMNTEGMVTNSLGIYDIKAVSIYQTNNSSSLPIVTEGGLTGFSRFTPQNEKQALLERDQFDDNESNDPDHPQITSLMGLLTQTELKHTMLCYIIIAISIMMFREMYGDMLFELHSVHILPWI